jgi:hypothetical protein
MSNLINNRIYYLRWIAASKVLDYPKGIMWESMSEYQGFVDFLKVFKDTCLTIITPRVIALVFNTSGEFVKDLVENKLLNYSLEICLDVVKADLALEHGEAELGDPF